MSLEDENRTKNKIIDERLRSSGIIDSQVLASFDEAYNYDAASTMNWLIAKLKILKDVIGQGGIIQLESSRKILNKTELDAWIYERYPDIADRI